MSSHAIMNLFVRHVYTQISTCLTLTTHYFIFPSTHLSIPLHKLTMHPSTHRLTYLPTYLPIHLTTYLQIYLFNNPSIHSFTHSFFHSSGQPFLLPYYNNPFCHLSTHRPTHVLYRPKSCIQLSVHSLTTLPTYLPTYLPK